MERTHFHHLSLHSAYEAPYGLELGGSTPGLPPAPATAGGAMEVVADAGAEACVRCRLAAHAAENSDGPTTPQASVPETAR